MKLRFPSLFVSLASLLSISSALAEETPASSSEAGAPIIEEVIVTGSLLPRGDFVSKAPISTISSTQFEMSNSVNVESLINSMPQVVGGADRSSTFGQGIATANLRGLGENRTLVLVNSRRFVPSFPDGGTVDLNFVPVGLIDRVEILTGGASAAYGSDALAGVINFILKDQTDGWEFNGGGEMTERGDAEIFNFNATNGGTFASGKGSYLVHFDLLERKALNFIEREISRVALVDSLDEDGNRVLVRAPNKAPISETGGLADFRTAQMVFFDKAGRDIAPLNRVEILGFGYANPGFGAPDGSANLGNINGYANLQLPQERESFKGQVSYEFDQVEVYADIYYSKSDVPFNWGGPFNGYPTATSFNFPIENNPFWSDEAKDYVNQLYQFYDFLGLPIGASDENQNGIIDSATSIIFTRGFTNDVGPTETRRTFESVQLEMGVKGDINSSWGYEIFAQTGEVESTYIVNPLLDPRRIQQGLRVTEDGRCADLSNGCVPINVWSDDIGPEAAAFITYPAGTGTSVTNSEQTVFMATLSGNTAEWFTIPGDPGPIGLVVGAEYRKLDAKISTSTVLESNQFIGFAEAPNSLDAEVDNKSIFAEALVPLASGLKGIDFLELELGWRFSDHSQTGTDQTYKVAISYYATPELHLRTSYNRAMRSPSISELFSIDRSTGGTFEPCLRIGDGPIGFGVSSAGPWSVERTPEVAAICASQGQDPSRLYTLPDAFLPSSIERGGNEELLAEDASTQSVGIVWTPYLIDGLSMSIDYFNVEIENYIEKSPYTPDIAMRACFDPDFGKGGVGSVACDSFIRNAQGNITSILLGYQNLGLHTVNGWDFNIEYGTDFLTGYLDINYFATRIIKRNIEDDTVSDLELDCLGVFNGDCDRIIDYPVFEFKHRMTAAWSKNNLDLQLVWKYTSALDDGNDDVVYFTEKLDAYSVIDLSGRYSIKDNWMITVGVKNLLDEKPQTLGSNSWETALAEVPSMSNTYAEYYDVFGRTWFLKASYNL
ncbi:MAG: hypothetical protein CBD27_01055 [Rhodospirillaceae bacterium TMED167]|nr:MAG: hypothetical protein CBD27_01055 [Rhodospirillaceae bacterium TMED167]